MDNIEQERYDFITPDRLTKSVITFIEKTHQQIPIESLDTTQLRSLILESIDVCKEAFFNYRQLYRSIPDLIKDSMNITFASMALIKTKAPPEYLNLYVVTDLMNGNTRNLAKHFNEIPMSDEDRNMVGLALSLYENRFQAAAKEFKESKLWMIANIFRRVKRKPSLPFPSEFLSFDRQVINTVFPPPKKQETLPKKINPQLENHEHSPPLTWSHQPKGL